MGCGSGGDSSSYRNDSTCLCRQEDATTYAGDIRSDSGADGRRWSCGTVGLQDVCLVGLSALVSADPVLVDLLGSVSYQFHVEEGADTSKRCNSGG